MRISDWSSDVCSSDLGFRQVREGPGVLVASRFILAGVAAAEDFDFVPEQLVGLRSRFGRLALGDHAAPGMDAAHALFMGDDSKDGVIEGHSPSLRAMRDRKSVG